ncbi:serine--tRNA ligase [Patescibacteria group bacterium]
MLDIKYLNLVKDGARKKNVKVDIDRWVELDDQRKLLRQELDGKREIQNKASVEIAKATDDVRQEKIAEMSSLKNEIKEIEGNLSDVEIKWKEILMNIPNVPSSDMPEGNSEDDNVMIKEYGDITKFDFDVKDHIQLGKDLDIIDIEKAAEVSGSRFFYLKNEAVLIQLALVNFVFSVLMDEKILKEIIDDLNLDISSKAFVPMLPPVMIRHEVQEKIHRVFGDQTYQFSEDGLNLVASAEHTMAPYHMNEVVEGKELPLRYIGYSTAFRREAGTYGKDMGGILRTHQFDKLEMESFTDAESGIDEQKFIVGIQEYLVKKLNIPYRLVHVCTGDTGKPDYNQFDIECWMPGQEKYRETHTSDYMTDFQTRGIKSFYKDEDGKRKLLHTNDATAFAIGRMLIAILENYQQVDGSVVVPEVLRKWMPGEMGVIKKK